MKNWRKVLYTKQDYPTNYMEYNYHYKKEFDDELIYDINRLSSSISSIFMFYCIYLNSNTITDNNLIMVYFIVFFGAYLFSENWKEFFHFLRLSSIILICVYILSPVIRSLAADISTDLICFMYFFLGWINVYDTVKSMILCDEIYRKQKDNYSNKWIIPDYGGKTYNLDDKEGSNDTNLYDTICREKNRFVPLKLEESIYINMPKDRTSILAYNTSIMASILLSSRLNSDLSVNFLMTISFIIFILLPILRDKYLLHRRTIYSLSELCLVGYCLCGNSKIIFSFFIFIELFIYLLYYICVTLKSTYSLST
ncbi:hypothetical protein TCON_1805 [Astathelohania contejeani]|uniref:Uncharacterized protein n=1 Tax=Astathelohania contejeani TaxID=164912 RepID=A0ABQ7HXZ9_9MICR|nr:hypothetical protein TCON_1805 [Thelohania contejeani]